MIAPGGRSPDQEVAGEPASLLRVTVRAGTTLPMIAPWRAPCGRGSPPHSGGPPERRATTMTTHTNVTLGATSAGSRTRTVLVADESDQVRAVITDNLTADGYCVDRKSTRLN